MRTTDQELKSDSWRLKIVLVILSASITCGLANVATELYIRRSQPYWTPDTLRAASLEYEPTIFSRHAFPQMVQRRSSETGAIAIISAQGYRGETFAIPKPENSVRIVVLGGSAAFDVHAPQGRDWPHLVEKELQNRGYSNVEVINAGTPGHATWDSLGRLYSEIWMFDPDYLVVYHAWNDIKDFKDLSPNSSLLRNHSSTSTFAGYNDRLVGNPFIYYTGPLDRFLAHSQLYVRLRSQYWHWQFNDIGLEGAANPTQEAETQYSDWGPKQYKLNLSLIADAARNIGATPIFLTQARLVTDTNSEAEQERIQYQYVKLSHQALVQAFADTDQVIFDVAESKNVTVLPLSKLNGQSDLFVDHVHTTPKGSEIIALTVADFLMEVQG